jgi:large subunit ribosomal protein L22
MEAKAVSRHVRMSPQKVRLVVDLVRGKGVEEALNILDYTPKRAARVIARSRGPRLA